MEADVKKVVGALCSLMMLCGVVWADSLPMVVVEVRGVEPVLQAAAQIARFQPGSMELMMLQMGAYSPLLAVPQNSGIDPAGRLMGFLYMDNSSMIVDVSSQDERQFHAGFGAAGSAPVFVGMIPLEGDGGTYMANLDQVAPEMPADDDLPEGMSYRVPGMYVLRKGNRVFISDNSEGITRTVQLLQDNVLPRSLPIAGNIAVQLSGKQYAGNFAAGAAMMPDEFAGIFKAQADMYGQIDTITYGVGLSGGIFRIYVDTKYVQDSVFDRYGKGLKPLSPASRFAIPENALIGFAVNTENSRMINDMYTPYFNTLFTAMASGFAMASADDPQSAAEFKKLTDGILNLLNKAMAIEEKETGLALLPPTAEAPFQALLYAVVPDAGTYYQQRWALLQDAVALGKNLVTTFEHEADAERIVQAMAAFSITQKEDRDFQGIPIKRSVITWPEEFPIAETLMDSALLKGLVLDSIGSSRALGTALAAYMKKEGTPLTERAFWKALSPNAKPEVFHAAYIHLFDVFRALRQIIPDLEEVLPALPATAGKGSIIATAYRQDGKLLGEVSCSLRDIHALIDYATPMIMQSMSGGMMGGTDSMEFEMEEADFQMDDGNGWDFVP